MSSLTITRVINACVLLEFGEDAVIFLRTGEKWRYSAPMPGDEIARAPAAF